MADGVIGGHPSHRDALSDFERSCYADEITGLQTFDPLRRFGLGAKQIVRIAIT